MHINIIETSAQGYNEEKKIFGKITACGYVREKCKIILIQDPAAQKRKR
jgi:hypothetical protein